MSIFNPLNPGPTQPNPYQQPNTSAPPANANVASYPTGANSLSLTFPIPAYVQPGQVDTEPGWANEGGALPSVA